MNKAVLISVRPNWCELIANRIKTIEVRKTKPALKPPFKCYIYCTKPKSFYTIGNLRYSDDELYRMPNGQIKYGSSVELIPYDNYTEDNFLNSRVIGEFICDRIIRIDCDSYAPFDKDLDLYIDNQCCMSREQLCKYTNGHSCYGFHISTLKIYNQPKELSSFITLGALSYEELADNLCNYCKPTGRGETKFINSPNGCHMCEGRFCNEAYETYLQEFSLKRAPQNWCYVKDMEI